MFMILLTEDSDQCRDFQDLINLYWGNKNIYNQLDENIGVIKEFSRELKPRNSF